MATFSFVPLYAWESTAAHRVLTSTLEGGREQRKYKGARPREWTLSFRATSSTVEAIVAFFNARKGSFESFAWVVPGTSTAVTVRFKDEALSVAWSGTSSGEIASVTLKEVL